VDMIGDDGGRGGIGGPARAFHRPQRNRDALRGEAVRSLVNWCFSMASFQYGCYVGFGLSGRLQIRKLAGAIAPLPPSDIALLGSTWAHLWRYEQRGLPVASQPGKDFLRRREVQDLLAQTRALIDAADTLAFGAFMRGPFG